MVMLRLIAATKNSSQKRLLVLYSLLTQLRLQPQDLLHRLPLPSRILRHLLAPRLRPQLHRLPSLHHHSCTATNISTVCRIKKCNKSARFYENSYLTKLLLTLYRVHRLFKTTLLRKNRYFPWITKEYLPLKCPPVKLLSSLITMPAARTHGWSGSRAVWSGSTNSIGSSSSSRVKVVENGPVLLLERTKRLLLTSALGLSTGMRQARRRIGCMLTRATQNGNLPR